MYNILTINYNINRYIISYTLHSTRLGPMAQQNFISTIYTKTEDRSLYPLLYRSSYPLLYTKTEDYDAVCTLYYTILYYTVLSYGPAELYQQARAEDRHDDDGAHLIQPAALHMYI